MTKRFLRPLQYTALIMIPQLAAAQAEEPKQEPVWFTTELGAICTGAGWSIQTSDDGRVRLVDGDGAVIPTKTDLDVFNGWLKRCPKGGAK